MKTLNFITDYRLNQLIKGKPIKALENLQNKMNAYIETYRKKESKLNSHISEEEMLSKSIIYLHTERSITLRSKQIDRVLKLKKNLATENS